MKTERWIVWGESWDEEAWSFETKEKAVAAIEDYLERADGETVHLCPVGMGESYTIKKTLEIS